MTIESTSPSTPSFPYVIAVPDSAPTHTVTIRTPRETQEYKDLFILVNADLNVASNGEHSTIDIRHHWAKDNENDRCYYARFNVDSVQLLWASSGEYVFSTWLINAMFWDDPDKNPFIGAVRREPENAEDYYVNSGYPYLPRSVHTTGLKLPMKVEISIETGDDPERLAAWLAKF